MDDTPQPGLTQKLAKLRQRIVDLERRQHSNPNQAEQYRAMLSVAPNLQESLILTQLWGQMEQLAQTVAHEKALVRLIARIRQTLDIETILGAATQGVRQILGCDRAVVYRFGSDWSLDCVGETVASGWISLNQPNHPTVWRDTELQTTRGGKYRHHECSAVSDIYRAALSECHIQVLTKFQIRAYSIAPIFVDKKLWGLLAAHQNSGPRPWKQRELNLLSQVGNHLGVALQQANLLTQAQAAREKAEAANRAKSEFLAYISHELRTPLTSILGYSQILACDPRLTPTQYEQLGTIVHSGDYLVSLLGNILDISKIEAGGVVLNQGSFDLYDLLKSLEEMFQLKAVSKRLQLIFDYDANLPRSICTDQGKLHQVLINLLDNAIKFTQTGEVIVRVKVDDQGLEGAGQGLGMQEAESGKWKAGGDLSKIQNPNSKIASDQDEFPQNSQSFPISNLQSLIFEVEDTGLGMTSADLNILFKPFVQTEAGVRSQAGAGLGLAISHQLIELMGGTISVDSVLGQGSVFRFNIPAGLPQSLGLATGYDDCVSQPGRADMPFNKTAEPLGECYCDPDERNSRNMSKGGHTVVMDRETLYKALASMSDDWLNKLRHAALSAREKKIFDLIEQIPTEHSLLNQALSQWVNTLQFDQIVDLTNHSTYGSPKT